MVIKRTVHDRLAVLESRFSNEHFSFNNPVELAVFDTDGEYQIPPHIELLNQKLVDVANGDLKRLMVFLPPRHGKSMLVSEYFPAWYLSHYPNNRIILCSYDSELASSFGRKVRNLIKEHETNLGVMVDQNTAAAHRWNLNQYKGGMVCAGVMTGITGKGSHILLIDDPVRDAAEANSETLRQRTLDWYYSTAYTRLEPDGAVIIVQTRWNEGDLSGSLIKAMEDGSGDRWEIISLPALAEEDDILGRELDEPLWPERFPLDVLLEKKAAIGSYWWSSLYQQRPAPQGGGILKSSWIRYYEKAPRDLIVFQGWDLAISQKTSADYTVCTTIGVNESNGDIYVLDWYRDRIDFPSQVRKVKEKAENYNPSLIALESTAFQAALPQAVLKDTNLPVKQVKPISDKITRITASFVALENGKVFFPKDHPLLEEFVKELTYFPAGKWDDMLDSLQMCLSLASTARNPYTESYQFYEGSLRAENMKGYEKRHWRRKYEVRK